MEISVRQITDTEVDVEAVAEAHVEGWRVGYRGRVPDELLDSAEFRASRYEVWRAAAWREWRPGSTMYVVLLDGAVVGFGHVGEEYDDAEQPTGRGELYGFYLHPRAWGSGAADALIGACEARLAELGFDEAILYVLRDNPRGRRFYERSGWVYDPAGDGSFEMIGATIADVRYRRTLGQRPVGR